jgi:lysozyme
MANKTPQINRAGLDLITRYEGFRPKPYKDVGGVVTIGYGHTRSAVMPSHVTEEEAVELLMADLQYFCKAVADAVTVPINENQFSALVAFTYNLGEGNLHKSTLLKKLNAGDHGGASDEFRKWVKAGQQELKGLVRRRAAEEQLFRTPPPVMVSTHEMTAQQALEALSGEEGINPNLANAMVVMIVPGTKVLAPQVEDDNELQQAEVSIASNEGEDPRSAGHPDIGIG